jgi:osmotically inducible protein OsmC
VPYNFSQRFEGQPGSSPEELIAAAHAACFAMATSAELGGRGLTPESLEASCTITFEKVDGKFTVTESHLALAAKVPGADRAKFDEAVKAAETGCPISRLLKTKITVEAKLL